MEATIGIGRIDQRVRVVVEKHGKRSEFDAAVFLAIGGTDDRDFFAGRCQLAVHRAASPAMNASRSISKFALCPGSRGMSISLVWGWVVVTPWSCTTGLISSERARHPADFRGGVSCLHGGGLLVPKPFKGSPKPLISLG